MAQNLRIVSQSDNPLVNLYSRYHKNTSIRQRRIYQKPAQLVRTVQDDSNNIIIIPGNDVLDDQEMENYSVNGSDDSE